MSATAALILLLEAAATCGPAAPTRVPAGAIFVEAIVTLDPEAFEPSEATLAGVTVSVATDQRDASPQTVAPDAGEAAVQCAAISLPVA